VLSTTDLVAQAKEAGVTRPGIEHIIQQACKQAVVNAIEVPADMGVGYVERLRALGLKVSVVNGCFYPERLIKSDEEIAWIEQSIRATEAAVARAIETLKQSTIGDDGLLYSQGQALTAEALRTQIHLDLLKADCLGQHTIVACAEQGVDPHNRGSGPLRAHQPIILDVFPQHTQTRYFADLTRTVVRGRASERVRKLFAAVLHAQQIAFERIRPGVDAATIHRAILDYFEEQGFKTGRIDGRMQGFFHGTGHGVGLEIHEAPRIGMAGDVLQAGMTVTVEPGLYYAGVGGMRLEDIVVVTADGCRNLNRLPKVLEV
jgi:Xaa-Pro aminopeptidase